MTDTNVETAIQTIRDALMLQIPNWHRNAALAAVGVVEDTIKAQTALAITRAESRRMYRERADAAEARVRELEDTTLEAQAGFAMYESAAYAERERAEAAEARVRELEAALQGMRGEADRAWAVLDWLAENMPRALELCPYKAPRALVRVADTKEED